MGASTALAGEVSSWSIDSRTLQPGDVFFAIEGETHDGHDFVTDVLQRGAAAAVIHRGSSNDPRVIAVNNTITAIQRLAAHARSHFGGTVVGVTGSAGKTTTKDTIAALLETSMPVGRTVGNFNNHIGLPLSILRLPDSAKAAVLEFGMNHAGEIAELTRIGRPQIAVVTNVGYAHVQNFADGIEGISRAKRELVDALPRDGVAVLNYEDERVRRFRDSHSGKTIYYGFSPEADVCAVDLDLREDGTSFRIGETLFRTALSGRHAVLNVLAAIAVARVFGIDDRSLRDAVSSLEPGKMRGERLHRNGITIINDCYNSNPEAVRNMLDVLRDTPAQRHIAVLGEMLELGHWAEPLHRDVGGYAARCGISVLVGIRGVASAFVKGAVEHGLRKDAAYFFDEPEQAGDWLKTLVQPGDAILFKGSRGTRVEKALDRYLEQVSR
jgi:UDP-N-acetylmuramoyl-tripeptide--D-alanyl-D-alanine ligase